MTFVLSPPEREFSHENLWPYQAFCPQYRHFGAVNDNLRQSLRQTDNRKLPKKPLMPILSHPLINQPVQLIGNPRNDAIPIAQGRLAIDAG